MKKLSKLMLLSAILLIMLFVPKTFAASQNDNGNQETNYNIITEEDKVKFKKFIEVKQEYKKYIIFAGISFAIVILMIIKSKTIQVSTKLCILLAILALGAYIVKACTIGNIIYIADIFLQFLGVILIVLSNFYIYKHDNLLIYIPICILGIYYSSTQLEIVKNNKLCQIFLISAPIVLYILGIVIEKVKEAELIIPVKEKHERKKDENR